MIISENICEHKEVLCTFFVRIDTTELKITLLRTMAFMCKGQMVDYSQEQFKKLYMIERANISMLSTFIKNIILSAEREQVYEECIYTFNPQAEFKQLNDDISVKRYGSVTHTLTTYNNEVMGFIRTRNLLENYQQDIISSLGFEVSKQDAISNSVEVDCLSRMTSSAFMPFGKLRCQFEFTRN